MIFFLDASALAKRYLLESGSERVRQLFQRQADIAVSRVSEVEVASALIRRVMRGDLERARAEAHLEALVDDMAQCDVVELRAPVVSSARELVWTHRLRAYDGIQLASALRAKGGSALTFLCADGELATAASRERLRVERLDG